MTQPETNDTQFFDDTLSEAKAYVNDRFLMFRLKAIDKSSRLTGTFVTAFLLIMFSFFIMFFLSVMAGYYFGELLGSLYAGFGIVAGIYLILLLILLVKRSVVERKVADTVVRVIFDRTSKNL